MACHEAYLTGFKFYKVSFAGMFLYHSAGLNVDNFAGQDGCGVVVGARVMEVVLQR